jgi:ribonuclease HIII
MRFSVTRLCGGKALMAASREPTEIDMDKAADVLSEIGTVRSNDGMMLVLSWKDMEVTIYQQGKVMFHPLDDRNTAITYANEILSLIM